MISETLIQYFPLARRVANKFFNPEDCFQHILLFVLSHAEGYDPSLSQESTFIINHIHYGAKNFLREERKNKDVLVRYFDNDDRSFDEMAKSEHDYETPLNRDFLHQFLTPEEYNDLLHDNIKDNHKIAKRVRRELGIDGFVRSITVRNQLASRVANKLEKKRKTNTRCHVVYNSLGKTYSVKLNSNHKIVFKGTEDECIAYLTSI